MTAPLYRMDHARARKLAENVELTIEWEGDQPYGVMRRDGKEFREPLPTTLLDYTEEKQRYWMRRCLVDLEKHFK